MVKLVEAKAVKFEFNSNVEVLDLNSVKIKSIQTNGHICRGGSMSIAGADYHHEEGLN